MDLLEVQQDLCACGYIGYGYACIVKRICLLLEGYEPSNTKQTNKKFDKVLKIKDTFLLGNDLANRI